MKFVLAPELKSELVRVIDRLGFSHIKSERIITFRSYGSKGKAVARIWSLPKIWQIAFQTEAHYCIEFISERFDKLSPIEKEKVLIHELLHVPKNFSGSLLPHRHHKKKIDKKTVEKLQERLNEK